MQKAYEILRPVISLGAGVQSSVMSLMAAHGEIEPMPAAAIFADTQGEPVVVYEWLAWLESQLPFPVYRVTHGDLGEDIARKAGKFRRIDIPAFVFSSDRKYSLINRSCTRDYKLRPVQSKIRELLGLKGKHAPKYPLASCWIGISTDEASRMKPSRLGWIEHRWPLIEMRMSRSDCLQWMKDKGYPQPPKSSCVFCPFHSDKHWRSLTADEARQAVEIDERLRAHPADEYRQRGTLFLHRSGRPLADVLADQAFVANFNQINMFENECEGICGV